MKHLFDITKKIKIDRLENFISGRENPHIDIARFDLLHPVVSGNKFFKLKYNIQMAHDAGYSGIITMGGAYSNHLAATAFACREMGLNAKAILRGAITHPLNHTLSYCTDMGMEIITVPRNLFDEHADQVQNILAEYPEYYFIPYGGSNKAGIKGASEMMAMIENYKNYDVIVCSIGSGTMLRGILETLHTHQTLIGIPAMKIKNDLHNEFIRNHSKPLSKTKFYFEYAGNGFGKADAQTLSFMNMLYEKYKIPTDFVYTGKLCLAVQDLILRNEIQSEQKTLIIHSGGLQGNHSIKKEVLIF